MNDLHDIQAREIEQLVAQTRQRLRRNLVLTGLTWAVGAVLAWLLLGAAIDMLAPLPEALRIAVWAVLWVLVIGGLGALVLWPAIRPLRTTDVAFRMERTLPGMHNRLVTVLDLRQRNGDARADEVFVDRLLQQTRQRLADFRVERVASSAPVRRGAITAGSILLAGVVLALLSGERMPTALARVLRPTADIAPASWVKLRAEPGDTEVLQGDPVTLRAAFERGEADDLRLRLRAISDGGPGDAASADRTDDWYSYPMTRGEDGGAAYTIDQVTSSYDYQIVGGGTWTPVHRVRMLRRPIIEGVDAAVRLPEYMALPEPRPVPDNAAQISAPIGSLLDLAAAVSGDPAQGRVQLYNAVHTTAQETRSQELVWFDDDLPADAEAIGQWRWTADRHFSGARGHTFGWSGQPYGFRTRLSKLAVRPEATLFTYAWLDPQSPPRRIILTFTLGPDDYALTWGEPLTAEALLEIAAGEASPAGAPPADAKVPKLVEMGPLPEPGQWARLEAPMATVLGTVPAAPTPVSGVTFNADGRVFFDRVGSLQRQTEAAQRTTLEPTLTLPMTRDAESGRWHAQVQVQVDAHYALEFANARGHASVPMKPVPIVVTQDQPPAVLVEKPGKSVTLADPEPLPLMVRALDDYGVASVALETGPTAESLSHARWLAQYEGEPPQQNRLVLGSLDPKALRIEPGQSLYYRISVRDRKGQVAHSEAYRLGLAAPGAPESPDTEKPAAPAAPLLESLASLLQIEGRIGDAAAQLLRDLPPGVLPQIEPGETLELKNPDGTPMTPEQVQAMLAERMAQLSPEQQQQMTELQAQLAERHAQQAALAQQLQAAAQASAQSALSLPTEAAALQQMAQQMQELAGDAPAPLAQDPEVMERLRELAELTPQQQAELEELRRQLGELDAARQAMGEDPEQAQSQMAALLAELQAGQAARQMDHLDAFLEAQREELERIRQEIAALEAHAAAAPGRELDEVGAQQQALDAAALEELRRAQDVLRGQLAAAEPEEVDEMPPAPWVAPGQRGMAEPVEADTPEEAKPEADPAAADPAAGEDGEAEDQEEEEWWDRPVDAPMIGSTLEDDPRYAERDPRETPPADPEQGEAATPREMLREHQREFQRHLGKQAQAMQGARERAGQMSSQMRQLMEQMRSGSPEQQAAAQQQLRQMLASQAMQGAQAAAARAAAAPPPGTPGSAQSQQASAQQPAGAASEGELNARPGSLISYDLGPVIIGEGGAAIYRLPPRVREPLIQGMQERGPEGYQPLIDAYYRQISKDASSQP